MAKSIKAKEPFRFYTRLHLTELTGIKAANLTQLLAVLREISGSSVYHHTHRFLQQHQFLSPQPPNDFAYWVSKVLGDEELGEQLDSIDTVQFATIRDLRAKIISVIEAHLKENPQAAQRFAFEGDEFHFMKAVSFIVPTNYVATDLKEFIEIVKKVTIDSIYFHVFEARLRLEKTANDFSNWIDTSLGDKALADKLMRLDPYTQTLEDLRKVIIEILRKKIR